MVIKRYASKSIFNGFKILTFLGSFLMLFLDNEAFCFISFIGSFFDCLKIANPFSFPIL